MEDTLQDALKVTPIEKSSSMTLYYIVQNNSACDLEQPLLRNTCLYQHYQKRKELGEADCSACVNVRY